MIDNNCCCDCSLKQGICILDEIISSNLVDNISINYNIDQITATITPSLYGNLLHINYTLDEIQISKDICISKINFFKIVPVNEDYQSIVNILNKYYQSPFCIYVNDCNENCCCKDSFTNYLRDKYLEQDPQNRSFTLEFESLGNNKNIPDSNDDDSSVVVSQLDDEIVWAIDLLNKTVYLASLCQISSVYTSSIID